MLRFAIAALAVGCTIALASSADAAEAPSLGEESTTLRMVVMDPLAKELSCPCVQGYAQRDYAQLAKYLESQLGVPVAVTFSESLVKALKEDVEGRADIVIGKRSVVEHDARRAKLGMHYAGSLTGKDGKPTQYGMLVVRTADKASKVADLAGYKIYFGPEESDEKHAAAIALLKLHGVALPTKLETVAGCEEGAAAILEMGSNENGAAVISSYAHPLLEGCGTVPKGAIRVVAETEPVPFVTAFVSDRLSVDRRRQIVKALLDIDARPDLKLALETKRGFISEDTAQAGAATTAADAKKK